MKNEITIDLGHHFKNFLQQKVASGKYLSEGEVIRSALRFFENKARMDMHWSNALRHSWLYEDEEDFDPEAHMEQVLRQIELESQDDD